MKLQEISIVQFRNFHHLHLFFHKKVNLFVGQNGQGKTNFLEAINFLVRGGSFRPGKNEIFINNKAMVGKEESGIRGIFQKHQLSDEVKVNIELGRKKILHNKKHITGLQLTKAYPSVLFCPDSLQVIKDGPEKRRVLLDDFIQTHYHNTHNTYLQYKRCHAQRNKLLRNFRQGLIEEAEVLQVLESLDSSYISLCTDVCWARIQGVRALMPYISKGMDLINGDKPVDISMDYVISGKSAIAWEKKQVYDALVNRRIQLKTAELSGGTSLVGPHKHDVIFWFGGQDARFMCSQGQQRALILAFKIAQVLLYKNSHDEFPLLLLDDVFSEIDLLKRRNLVNFLKTVNSQIFLTTTEDDFVSGPKFDDISKYEVNNGLIELQN